MTGGQCSADRTAGAGSALPMPHGGRWLCSRCGAAICRSACSFIPALLILVAGIGCDRTPSTQPARTPPASPRFAVRVPLRSAASSPQPSLYEIEWEQGRTATHAWTVQWGHRDGILVFVTLSSRRGDRTTFASPLISYQTTSDEGAYCLVSKPDGTRVRLPDGFQLHELTDGMYKERNADISLSEFEQFMQSEPSEYTIKALLRFVEQARAGRGTSLPDQAR